MEGVDVGRRIGRLSQHDARRSIVSGEGEGRGEEKGKGGKRKKRKRGREKKPKKRSRKRERKGEEGRNGSSPERKWVGY